MRMVQMSDEKIKALAGGGKPDPAAEAFRRLRANIEQALEAQRYLAMMTRARYVALVAEGFTEKQALDLCKEWHGA